MHVTHVVRGDDHVNNTPRQINILKALGATPPHYAHVPMILGADGVKLSKRHGAVGVIEYRALGFMPDVEYRALGFMPDAILNYLVRLGWSYGDEEIFSRERMIELFDISRVQKSPARFDMEKAIWVNHQYLKTADPALVAAELRWHLERLGVDTNGGPELEDVVISQRERCKTLVEMSEKSVFFYRDFDRYDEKAAAKNLVAEALPGLVQLRDGLAVLGDWTAEAIHALVERIAAQLNVKMGQVAQPARVAVSGGTVSPPIDATLALLGRDQTLRRLEKAIKRIESA
jgi:glutamyl-tRNA synthetase